MPYVYICEPLRVFVLNQYLGMLELLSCPLCCSDASLLKLRFLENLTLFLKVQDHLWLYFPNTTTNLGTSKELKSN